MHLSANSVARALLLVFAAGVLWAVAAFGAFAIFALLNPAVGVPAAAALTAGILALSIATGAFAYFVITRAPAEPTVVRSLVPAAKAAEQDVTVALAQLAKEHPFVAVGCALLLGVAGSVQAENRRLRG